MPRGKLAGQQTLRYKAAIIFALTSLLPLLLFLYVLDQKELIQDMDAAVALALSVLIAILGFALFQQTIRSIGRMADEFVRLEHGAMEELGTQQATHEYTDACRCGLRTILLVSSISHGKGARNPLVNSM